METTTLGDDSHARGQVKTRIEAASGDAELHFVFGRRYIRAGQTVCQGVTNHETWADAEQKIFSLSHHVYQADELPRAGISRLTAGVYGPARRTVDGRSNRAGRSQARRRWPLAAGARASRPVDAEPGAEEGQPSRWNTLRALRVLDWYAAGA